MAEVTLESRVRSRSHSQTSGEAGARWRIPPSPTEELLGAGERDQPEGGAKRAKNTKKRPHPAEQKKSVLLTLANNQPRGEAKPKPQTMLRRFSRAASFKAARQRLPMMDLRGILHRFERHSTIHGICHAALAPSKRWRHFWLSVFVVCFIILVVQVIYLALKFLQYPKTVDLDLKFENAPFPSVTICNLNPYKASAIRGDKAAKATIDAMETVLQEGGRTEGIAAAITNTVKRTRKELAAQERRPRRELSERMVAENQRRRYLQVYAQCYCELDRLSAVRRKGSCYAAYKNRVSLVFMENQTELHYFYPTKCLCQLDWQAKAVWPCFPYNTWKEHICVECVDTHGHCPMRFLNYNMRGRQPQRSGLYAIETMDESMDICVCHRDYNHCVANNLNGEIPEIMPGDDLELFNMSRHLATQEYLRRRGEVAQAVKLALKAEEEERKEPQKEAEEKALGFQELKDEIAIKTQARENLIFAIEEKPLDERVRLSQPKDELILKCSFNQHDCDIERDFKLYHDPTYGNCYTFNWDRNASVNAHRAGANYGLRVLVYANVSEYLPITEAVGFRITVHDKWTVPFVDAFGYNAPTGALSAFGVRMKKFSRLEHPYGRCKEGGEQADWYIYKGYNYSVEGCHRSCTQREVIRVCGCADPMFHKPEGATPMCRVTDPAARDCIKNTTRHMSALIAEDKLQGCNCPLPCYETGYEVTYSAANWPSGTAKLMECDSSDPMCMEKYRINAAMVQVFYEELNYETLAESPAYSVNSLVADLGGVLGLWIGISVVSILEVVQLIWFCMEYTYKKKTPDLFAMVRRTRSYDYEDESTTTPSKKASPASLEVASLGPRTHSAGTRSLRSIRSNKAEFMPPGMRIVQKKSIGSHSTGSTRTVYIAPDVELPCTCLYGARGQIIFMKPLCPFHGYMVRRIMRRSSSSSSSSNKGDNELEDVEEEGLDVEVEVDEELSAEEVAALQKATEADELGEEEEHKEAEEDVTKATTTTTSSSSAEEQWSRK